MKWFKHDANANADAKLMKVIIKHGLEGYGLYWYCLEHIAGNIELNNLTFELEHDAEILAHKTGLHQERVQEMMTDMVNLGLFENKNGTITCLKLARRLDQSMTSNPEMRKAIRELVNNHDSIMTESDLVMQDEMRIDEMRIEKPIVGSKLPPCPHEKIISLYHEMLPELPKIRTWTTTRRRHLQSRWREYPDLEDWRTFFNMVKKSPFLMGEIQNGDRRPFRASLDWLIKPENFAKTIEGKYRG